MCSREPVAPQSALDGGEVSRVAPALYWLTFEEAAPATCTACPFAEGIEGVAPSVVCRMTGRGGRLVRRRAPTCKPPDWRRQSRYELARLFRRLLPTDAELAEVAADLSARPALWRPGPPEAKA